MRALSPLIGGALPLAALAVGGGALVVPGAAPLAFVALALAGFWIGGYAIIVLHELAHAAAVLATGAKLRAIAFGVEPRRRLGVFQFGPKPLASARVEFDWGKAESPLRRLIIFGAGAAAEVALLAANVAILALDDGRAQPYAALALGALTAGVVSLRMTLNPRQLASGLYTDGYRMLQIVRTAQAQASQRWNFRSMLASVITLRARP